MLYRIPQEEGEFLISPKIDDIKKCAWENREKRTRFLRFFNFDIKDYIIVGTGHQTVFYHPGIWIKSLLMDYLNKEKGIKAVFIEHDVDARESICFIYPSESRSKRECIYYNPEKIALEYITSKKIENNLDYIINRIKDIRFDIEKKNAIRFFKILKENLKKHNFFPKAFSETRKMYENQSTYETVFLSEVFLRKNFFEFFSHFFLNAEDIFEVYNDSIIKYRKENNIKNPYEPAPLLERENNKVELPFFINLRKRYKVFKRDDKLICDKFDVVLGKNKEDVIKNSLFLPLRPRALILSLFQKVFLCDLFFHGVSGKNYDNVTDYFCINFFNIEPPVTGVISLTCFPESYRYNRDKKFLTKREYPFFLFRKEYVLNFLNL